MLDPYCRCLRLNLLAIAIAGLSGCSSIDGASNRIAGIVSSYTIDVVQGNVVTREQAAFLKPGMPRAQVRDVLGTSLLVSVFHADRWDYVFTLKRQGKPSQSRKLTVYFKDDVLERTESDDLPSEAEFVSTLKTTPPSADRPVLVASDEALKQFPLPSRPASVAGSDVAAPPDYPPLEASRP
jgi:outer membrane protein assembly factor BamE